jgi:type II secretory pathway pseudopilin PulG
MNVPMALPRTSSSESGFAIIEVIVSAVVLAIVALAVLSGIDAANGSSSREKARAVAANLAEQDQERMRAMSVKTLTAVPQAIPMEVDGVTYTIKSEAVWVTDDTGGTPSCGNSTNNAEYFHITSTVTSAIVGTRVPAVVIDSLVSPTVSYAQDHGTFGAKVVDRNDVGIPNIDVAAVGASVLPTKKTDQNGCVLWRSIPVGSYTASINVGGYGDETGVQAATRQGTVSPNTVTFVSFSYDRVAKSGVNVYTHVPGQPFDATNKTKPSTARAISDNMSDRTFPPAAPPIPVTNLFPYPTKSYGFFTGSCTYESPVNVNAANENYFASINTAASILATPGATIAAASVFQPPVQIRVSKDSAGNGTGAGKLEIHMTLNKPSAFGTDTCAEPEFVMQTMAWPASWTPKPGTAGTLPYASQSKTTFDPGMPFGTYAITCVVDTNPNPDKTYVPAATLLYDNTLPKGGAELDIAPATNKWTTQSC